MTWKVLVSAPYLIPFVDRFRPWFAENGCEMVVADVRERLEEADLLPIIGDYHAMVCGDDRVTAKVIAAAHKLKVISKWGTGIDSIDKAAAEARGIRVCRTRDAFSQPVGDTQWGYILAFARRQPWMDRMMKAGQWEKIPGRAMNESTVGVVGVGDTGKATARRAKGFGCRLLGNDIVDIDPAFIAETGIEMMPLDQLLEQADFVSVCCDLTPSSFHLFSDAQFKRMKSNAVIINTGRGPCIDEKALIRALQAGEIGGAALDVFEDEPLPVDSPLKTMDNVMMAPHNANSSPKAWERIHWSTLNQMLDVLKNG